MTRGIAIATKALGLSKVELRWQVFSDGYSDNDKTQDAHLQG
jgi:hypothetical protein